MITHFDTTKAVKFEALNRSVLPNQLSRCIILRLYGSTCQTIEKHYGIYRPTGFGVWASGSPSCSNQSR